VLAVHTGTSATLALPGLLVSPVPAGQQPAKSGLDVQLTERHDDRGRPAGLDGAKPLPPISSTW